MIFRKTKQIGSVPSMTGHRGSIIIWDDPISANSVTNLETLRRELKETLPSRFVDALIDAKD
jgi:hypothetical protein